MRSSESDDDEEFIAGVLAVADHPGPRVAARLQEQPDVEQPPRGALRPAAVLRIPGRLPLLLRYTGSVTHTHTHTHTHRSGAKWLLRHASTRLRGDGLHPQKEMDGGWGGVYRPSPALPLRRDQFPLWSRNGSWILFSGGFASKCVLLE